MISEVGLQAETDPTTRRPARVLEVSLVECLILSLLNMACHSISKWFVAENSGAVLKGSREAQVVWHVRLDRES